VTLQTSDSAAGKPSPEMLHNAMRDTGVEADFVFMVGDTTYDMSMAVNAGTKAIGVSWGYHEADELLEAGAEVVVHSYNELFAVLEEMTEI
jgi:phosphoglycolate phosphatase